MHREIETKQQIKQNRKVTFKTYLTQRTMTSPLKLVINMDKDKDS